jgi:transcriptional regulator with XRE-family HTH domain
MQSSRDSRRRLAQRMKQVRVRFFGEQGTADLAKHLGIKPETWTNYEQGVTIPAEILLAVLELTSVDPQWLSSGDDSPPERKPELVRSVSMPKFSRN